MDWWYLLQSRQINLKHYKVYCTWRSSVDPVPTDAVVDGTSVSSNPDRSVLYQAVRVTNYELLKHVVNILIRNDRQRWVSSRTKLSRFIPTQHWTIAVETIVLTVQRVTLWYLNPVYEDGRNITCTNLSKNVIHQAHIDNSVSSQRIFKICLLAHSEKFAIKQLLEISTNTERVAALPCEI